MQKQARHAVSVFHEMQVGSKKCGGDDRQAKANSLEKNAAVTRPNNRRYAERQENAVQQENREEAVAGETDVKKSGADWTGLYTELERAIKIRHYSPKTLPRNGDEITSATMHHSFRPPLPDLKSQKHQNSLLFHQLL
jgi:hypothetical protein